MKTSNKILVALIVFVFGTYATINGMLYAKIKKGVYVSREQYESSSRDVLKTDAFSKIELVNCGGVSLMNSDSFYLSVDKGRDRKFDYKVQGDKLIVTFKSVNDKEYIPLKIFGRQVSTIVLNNSDIYLEDFVAPNLDISATKNSFVGVFGVKIESLKLSTDNNTFVQISDQSTIGTIDLSLGGNSHFNPNMARISRIKASYISDSARIELAGKNLKAFTDTSGKTE